MGRSKGVPCSPGITKKAREGERREGKGRAREGKAEGKKWREGPGEKGVESQQERFRSVSCVAWEPHPKAGCLAAEGDKLVRAGCMY